MATQKDNEVKTWYSENKAAIWVLVLGFGAAVTAWATGLLKFGG